MSEQRFNEVLRQIIAKHDDALSMLNGERQKAIDAPRDSDDGTVSFNELITFIDGRISWYQEQQRVAQAALACHGG